MNYKIENKILIIEGDVNLLNSELYEKAFSNFIKLDYETLDLSEVKNYDTLIIVLIDNILELKPNVKINFGDNNLELFYNRFKIKKLESEKIVAHESFFVNLGNSLFQFFKGSKSFLIFLGQVSSVFLKIFTFRSKTRFSDLPKHFVKAGVNALPIVFLIMLLLGLITGYQGALQLKQFGADMFISSLVGISITRELAPLMTAILVAGRSGSAFTAEIGSMKLSEELDSLSVMGFNLIEFLVLPRVLAVVLSIPLLTIFGDLAGCIGGGLAATSTLDVTLYSYVKNLQAALTYGHVFSGIFKSIIFGIIIALVGCLRGLQVKSGSDSVGKNTTKSVVTSIFLIIVADAIFTYLFKIYDI